MESILRALDGGTTPCPLAERTSDETGSTVPAVDHGR